jgi:hypothetical protein
LKITNSFFRHKNIHKYTWTARGYSSIIDYVLINRKTSPFVQDSRVYQGYDINSDHFLLISKLSIPQNWQKSKASAQPGEEVFKINLLEDLSIKDLFQNRINSVLAQSSIGLDVNSEW